MMKYWIIAALAVFQAVHLPVGSDALSIPRQHSQLAASLIHSEAAEAVPFQLEDELVDADQHAMALGRELLTRFVRRRRPTASKLSARRKRGGRRKGGKKKGGKKGGKKSGRRGGARKGRKKGGSGKKKNGRTPKARSGGGNGSARSSGGLNRKGELTYYGGAGINGNCRGTWKPSGYKTVAINGPEYGGGSQCGLCVEACYTDKGGRKCFKAIVDNKCPECKRGDLDLGENGNGRWPLEWKVIQCPTAGKLVMRAEGSHAYYAKLKVEGGPGPVKQLICNGKSFRRTNEGMWEFNDGSGGFRKGLNCVAKYSNGPDRRGSIKV